MLWKIMKLEDEDELNDLDFGDSVVSRLCFF